MSHFKENVFGISYYDFRFSAIIYMSIIRTKLIMYKKRGVESIINMHGIEFKGEGVLD